MRNKNDNAVSCPDGDDRRQLAELRRDRPAQLVLVWEQLLQLRELAELGRDRPTQLVRVQRQFL